MTTDPDPDDRRPALAAGVPDDALAEINRLWTIARVFSNAAHEVNNALQVIAGNSELLEARTLDPDIKRRVETVRLQTERAAAVIDRLLTYVRARELPAHKQDVWPIVEAAVAMRAASAGRSRIRLIVDRQGHGPCWAMVDGIRALQAILDLLFTAESAVSRRPAARVTVGVHRRADRVVVVIAATGEAGTAAEPEVTESAATQAVTSGAQLWAAAHLASLQQGRVTVEESDRGSTLTLDVPAADS